VEYKPADHIFRITTVFYSYFVNIVTCIDIETWTRS